MEEAAWYQSSSVAIHENDIICNWWEDGKSSYLILLGPSGNDKLSIIIRLDWLLMSL
jgi:hypothetical protein